MPEPESPAALDYQTAGATKPPPRRDAALQLIAAFKLLKGSLLLLVAIGAFKLINKDLDAVATHWIQHFRADPHNKHLHLLLSKLPGVTHKKLELLSAGTLIYGTIFLIEGIGLLRRKRWAEYMTIVTTAGLIPVEIYEMVHHLTVVKVLVFLINIGIVAYLVWRVRTDKKRYTQAGADSLTSHPADPPALSD